MTDAHWFSPLAETVRQRAAAYVQAVRAGRAMSPLAAFQREYNLASHEGIMIMCLAEALLRIPDAATADALIADKLAAGEWDRHVGRARPWFVSVGSIGLGLAERISSPAGSVVGALVHRLGEPVVRGALKKAMKLMGSTFVLADTLDNAAQRAEPWRRKGYLFSYDMLGEGARTTAQAKHYYGQYLQAIETLAARKDNRDGVSIKLSALHPRVELRHLETLKRELVPVLRHLIRTAAEGNVPVTIDAEEAARFDITMRVFETVFDDGKKYEGLGMAVQAYQKRSPEAIAFLRTLAAKKRRRIPVRLVKGAYWDGEIKRAQAEGLAGYTVFTRKADTDVSYLTNAHEMLQHKELYPQFATHNAHTVASIVEMGGAREFEFQRLWGMGEELYEVALEEGRPCRIYAPIGTPEHLLSYLIRRILENGANSSFVRGLYDAPLNGLIANPFTQADMPTEPLPPPARIYAGRRNSSGIDLGHAVELEELQKCLTAWANSRVKHPKDANFADCENAFARAQAAFGAWSATPVERRAQCLEHLAELFEKHQDELMALCMHEAGKTVADCIAEVREGVDYCRYYAQEARRLFAPKVLPHISGETNTLMLHPRGVIAAISPWNFPLAIFTGQITAALVTGNCVLAKPAEETPVIAARAVALMHEAGIPRDVLQLLCGTGETIGAALVRDARVNGVVFTGSTQAAWVINRMLAMRNAPIAPLIAETGGQNCMLVDSSALIEQTVDDIIASAFFSAGQRCSCLRVAFVQEDIADTLLEVLAGAMGQLRVGRPGDFASDISSVISEDAYDKLTAHIEKMKRSAKLIAATPLPTRLPARRFVAPHAFEIESISELKEEVFGPILHVIRYKANALDAVIAQINSTGYGLTLGIQSRIDSRVAELSARVRAGNIYVNRTMTGAVVGAQPFGGSGLSGTGPKAGGPHYLLRFCEERTVTVNTAAVGGNLELLTR